MPEPHMGSRGFPVHGVKDFRRGECRATSMRETGLEPHYRHMASQISGVKHKEFGQIIDLTRVTELQAVMRLCFQHKTPTVVRGGETVDNSQQPS